MNYKIRLILYVISKVIIYLSVIGSLYSLVMIFVEQNNFEYWLIRTALFVIVTIITSVLFIIRKAKIPAAGKDYN